MGWRRAAWIRNEEMSEGLKISSSGDALPKKRLGNDQSETTGGLLLLAHVAFAQDSNFAHHGYQHECFRQDARCAST